MKLLRSFRSVAVSLLLAATALAGTRPQYGGTLRVELRAAPVSLDPAEAGRSGPNQAAKMRLTPLVFDTLVLLDENNQPVPRLALAWKHDAGFKHWEFTLRPNVVFSDAEPLTATAAADSLAHSNPGWKVQASGDLVVIELDAPIPHLPALLALPQNAIVRRVENALLGTGACRIAEFAAGQRAVLVSNPESWTGRPFVDRIEVQFNRSVRDQQVDFQVGKADIIEIPSDQLRRALSDSSTRAAASSPVELLAVVFDESRSGERDSKIREAAAMTVDRSAVANLLLQKQAEPAFGLLPQWIGGYEHLFRVAPDTAKAHVTLGRNNLAPISLMYDYQDLAAKAVAERFVAGAREAGVPMQAVGENLMQREGNADARVVRIAISSTDCGAALERMSSDLGLSQPNAADSARQCYESEKALLENHRVIPVVHVPAAYIASSRVRNWRVRRDGSLPLADLWLEAAPQ